MADARLQLPTWQASFAGGSDLATSSHTMRQETLRPIVS
jgi:hypothetical protein